MWRGKWQGLRYHVPGTGWKTYWKLRLTVLTHSQELRIKFVGSMLNGTKFT
jgi:hypothetical protein